MLSRQNIIEFTNLKETYIIRNNRFRVEIWYKTEESKTLSVFRPPVLNKVLVGTDCRHVLRTFNGMSHEIFYTGPLKPHHLHVDPVGGLYNVHRLRRRIQQFKDFKQWLNM